MSPLDFPCLCQNDSLVNTATIGTIKVLLEIMHLANAVIKLD